METAFKNIVYDKETKFFRVIFQFNEEYYWFGSFRKVQDAIETSLDVNKKLKHGEKVVIHKYMRVNS